MEKGFMYYYSLVWVTVGGLYNLYDFLVGVDLEAFWGVAISVPTIVWLITIKK